MKILNLHFLNSLQFLENKYDHIPSLKVIIVSNVIGCVGLVTDSKDENALNFYKRFGMKPFKNKPMTLYIKTKDILKYIE